MYTLTVKVARRAKPHIYEEVGAIQVQKLDYGNWVNQLVEYLDGGGTAFEGTRLSSPGAVPVLVTEQHSGTTMSGTIIVETPPIRLQYRQQGA